MKNDVKRGVAPSLPTAALAFCMRPASVQRKPVSSSSDEPAFARFPIRHEADERIQDTSAQAVATTTIGSPSLVSYFSSEIL
jgi:hypothetical protein